MSFDGIEYLKLAKELAGKFDDPPNKEAKLRSSISRAYYAAHWKARNHLLQGGKKLKIPEDGTAHIIVINHFRDSADFVQQKLGRDLNHLRLYRTDADYRDDIENIESTSKGALEYAERVINGLNSLSPQ